MSAPQRDGLRGGAIERFASLAAIPGLVHGLSTRALGDLKDAAVRARFAALLGIAPDAFVRGRQVHGVEVVEVGAEHAGRVVGERRRGADALCTRARGIVLLSLAADCIALGLVDVQAGVLAIAHAGWRPERMRAVISPAIGPCCYEVGEEVASRALRRPGGEEAVWVDRTEPDRRPRLDLGALVHADLRTAGLTAAHIEHHGACTRCERSRWFSYRGGDQSARFGLALGWRAAAR